MDSVKTEAIEYQQQSSEHDPPTELFDVHKRLNEFWAKKQQEVSSMTPSSYREINRHQELPLARIKKIMKMEDEVKMQMVSAEAPIILAKAAEFMIEELTLRSWVHTEESRRKTVQRSDIAIAVSRCEMFDFLIDIVPRDELLKSRTQASSSTPNSRNGHAAEGTADNGTMVQAQNVQYVVQGIGDGDFMTNPVLQLDNGQVLHATQIGPSIPLSGNPGQQIQLVTVGPNGEEVHLVPMSSAEQH